MNLNFDENDIIQISAKNGIGIDKVFDAIINKIPAPSGKPEDPPWAFLFNARHVETRGIQCMIELVDGALDLTKTRSLFSYHS